MVNLEVASSSSFRDIPKNHFLTAAEADIDDRIMRNAHVSVSHKNDKLITHNSK